MSCEQKVDLRQKAPENWSIATPVMPGSVDLAMQAGKLLDDVRTALDFDLGAAIRATAKLAALLGGNRGEMPPAGPALGGLAPWQKRKVRNHIERHIDSSIPVKDLAELVSLSTGHFCRAFKESFGDTPHAYVMRMRLERAQELMLASRNLWARSRSPVAIPIRRTSPGASANRWAKPKRVAAPSRNGRLGIDKSAAKSRNEFLRPDRFAGWRGLAGGFQLAGAPRATPGVSKRCLPSVVVCKPETTERHVDTCSTPF